ncbi:MAG: hypothetical protein JHC33_15165 [Ignisphaera sp.]|nr:hypothetical protein [Ignisphaera sp.]
MKKKLLMISLLTVTALSFADPISNPNNVSDTPVVIGNSSNNDSNSGAASDYKLKVGETAVIRFDNVTSAPLHIAISEPCSPAHPSIYEVTITLYYVSDKNIGFRIYPNNQSYSGQMQNLAYQSYSNYDWGRYDSTTEAFYVDLRSSNNNNATPLITTLKIVYFGKKYQKRVIADSYDNLSIALTSAIWNNTTTPWTSLGTFEMFGKNFSGQIMVKRIQ